MVPFSDTVTYMMFISSIILYIQYRRGLWKPAMNDLDIRVEGHVLTDEEFFQLCDYFYSCLQKKLKKKHSKNYELKQQLCTASNIVGDPFSKRSPAQASFRRDLRIACEAAGIGKCSLLLSEDHRFLDVVVFSDIVRRKLKTCMLRMLGIDFQLHVQALGCCSIGVNSSNIATL